MKRSGPVPLGDQVSRNLSRVKRRDTKPEIELHRELHRRGLRFRVDYGGVPGHPDVAFTRAKIAVFIDGCFWHGCDIHGSIPKNNAEWWRAKIERNRARDAEVSEQLRRLGWLVLRYWTHDDVDATGNGIERNRVSPFWTCEQTRTKGGGYPCWGRNVRVYGCSKCEWCPGVNSASVKGGWHGSLYKGW